MADSSAQASFIQITKGALDDWEGGRFIIRGVISPDCLHNLQVGEYQREILPETKIKDLMQVMIDGEALPDVELGMRGQDFLTMPDGVMVLKNPVYIIDGLQRISAGRMISDRGLGTPHLGCLVHFDTTEAWERNRFRALNLYRTKLSANVLLRNMRDESVAVDSLWHFSEVERTSPLYGRVCWQQRMQGSQLITAVQLLKAAGHINTRFGPGRSTSTEELVSGLDKTLNILGQTVFLGNVRRFFNTIDECWSIRRTTFKSGATHLRTTFVKALTHMFVEHEDFWDGQNFLIRKDALRKLKSFPIKETSVVQLAGSSGLSFQMLAGLIIGHINSGRRFENRLKPFAVSTGGTHAEEDDEPGEESLAG